MIVNLTKLHGTIIPYLFEDRVEVLEKVICPLLYSYEWQKGYFVDDFSNNLEQDLLDFLVKNEGTPSSDKVRVIIGGIGTGKSTTINLLLKKILSAPILCNRSTASDKMCHQKPTILIINFGEIQEAHDQVYEDFMEDDFWTIVSSKIETSTFVEISAEEEVSNFWSWCLKQNRLLNNSLHIQKHLEINKDFIYSYINKTETSDYPYNLLLKQLIKSRKAFIKQMNSKDLCWYKVFKYKYQLTKERELGCKCIYILLDDIDHLHPHIQKLAVTFAQNITEIYSARTLITIRPLTWEQSTHAHMLTETLNQFSPSIIDVIDKRIKWCLKEQPSSVINEIERKALISLTNTMLGKGKNNLLFEIIKSTSGQSVRFALRNFANMLESPLLSNISVFDNEPFLNVQESILARAYFFGTRKSLIPHAFENLYYVESTFCPLLKARILDFIGRFENGHTNILKLFNFGEAFGYEKDILIDALNELLKRSRPLIWCNVSYHLPKTISDARLAITPIGRYYLQNLFGEVLYDEVCLSKDLFDQVYIGEVYNFHQRIAEEDYKEIKSYCYKNGSALYKNLYYQPGKQIFSISFLHGKNLMRGLPNRIYTDKESKYYDPKRLDWIRNNIEEILNDPES